ncbi:MAG: hypothetical protein R3220_08065 [Balneolaceae bacterium]|nr:hypothetical protein [Balneolaceae bacterium]
MGLIENEIWNYEDAVSHLEKALDIDLKYTATYGEMASAYDNLGESNKAVNIYER